MRLLVNYLPPKDDPIWTCVPETFNHTLTRVEFLDLLKRTVSGYLDKKIAEYEAEIERI